MEIKSYACTCRVCGEDHEVKTEFLSSSSTTKHNRLLVNCDGHTREEVVAAYDHFALIK